ncbi:MAG TPA: LysR family transcriptional regulator [Ktedonobacterales bacterium]
MEEVKVDRRRFLEYLRILRAIAGEQGKARTYRAASEILGYTEPWVSRQMAQMSKDLHFKVDRREGRTKVLTEEARELLKATASLEELLTAANHVVNQLADGEGGTARLITSATVGSYVLPRVLGAFYTAKPGTKVALDFRNRSDARQYLRDRQVDLIMIHLDGSTHHEEAEKDLAELQIEPFALNEYVVVAPPNHRFAKRQQPISLEMLSHETFVVREEGSGTRVDSKQIFDDCGLPFRIGLVLPGSTAVKQAVQANLGIAILSKYAVEGELNAGSLIQLRVEKLPAEHTWSLARLAGSKIYRPLPAQALWDFMKTYRDAHRLLEKRAT